MRVVGSTICVSYDMMIDKIEITPRNVMKRIDIKNVFEI